MTQTIRIPADFYTKPVISAVPGMRADYRAISVLTTDINVTTVVVMVGVLPAGHRLIGFVVEGADMDAGTPALCLSFGILNTYYNEPVAGSAGSSLPVAAYNSGGATNTDVDPQIVAGHEILTAQATCGIGATRVGASTINYTKNIGVDNNKDRIIAMRASTAAATAAAGTIGVTPITEAA